MKGILKKEALEQERLQQQRLRMDYEQRLARLKERSQRKLTEEAEEVLAELRNARNELREVRKKAKGEHLDRSQWSELSQQTERLGKRLSIDGDLGRNAMPKAETAATAEAPADLSVGLRVFVPHLRSEASVLEIANDGRVRVAAGSLKLWVNANALRSISSPDSPATHLRLSAEPPMAQGPNSDNTVNVRGLRVDDALPMMESFIDRLRMGPARHGYVDHGHGSGALRKAVRDHLREVVPHICEVRPGRQDEGGDAVTAFTLEK